MYVLFIALKLNTDWIQLSFFWKMYLTTGPPYLYRHLVISWGETLPSYSDIKCVQKDYSRKAK